MRFALRWSKGIRLLAWLDGMVIYVRFGVVMSSTCVLLGRTCRGLNVWEEYELNIIQYQLVINCCKHTIPRSTTLSDLTSIWIHNDTHIDTTGSFFHVYISCTCAKKIQHLPNDVHVENKRNMKHNINRNNILLLLYYYHYYYTRGEPLSRFQLGYVLTTSYPARTDAPGNHYFWLPHARGRSENLFVVGDLWHAPGEDPLNHPNQYYCVGEINVTPILIEIEANTIENPNFDTYAPAIGRLRRSDTVELCCTKLANAEHCYINLCEINLGTTKTYREWILDAR